jgi:hypothetical protein
MLRACAPDALDIFHGPWAGGFAAVDAAAAVLHCWLTAQFWPLTSLGTTAFDLP